MNINNCNIIYSIDIDKKITKFIGLKKEKVIARSLMLVNNNIYIFLKNSHLIKFDLTGEIEEITRLPSNLKTNPFFVNSSLFYLDKRNKILKIN